MEQLEVGAEEEKRAAVRQLSHKHEAILQFMATNPEVKLGDVAIKFGVTAPWLSTLKGSDLFQARLAQLQGEVFQDLKQDMHLRLRGLAEVALDRMAEKVRNEEDLDKVGRAAQLALEACGYASRRGQATAVNMNSVTVVGAVDKSQLAAARELLRARAQLTLPPPAPEGETSVLTAYDAEAQQAAG